MRTFLMKEHTVIIQKYITNPLLVNQRKFDIRVFAMVTSINGVNQGYYYQEGYIRTSSREFDLEELDDRFVHLTNDAIQKHDEEYGKYEFHNKLSYTDMNKYVENMFIGKSFFKDVEPQIKEQVTDTIRAVANKLNVNRRQHCFEVFGYDFMVDTNFKVWLIEVNSNPCLETSSSLLSRIIPNMLDNAFKIALDPIFISNSKKHHNEPHVGENKFELVYNSTVYGEQNSSLHLISEDENDADEVFSEDEN